MTRLAWPYRRPPRDVVQVEPWVLSTDDGDVPLPEALPDWDYQMNLQLHRKVRVDPNRAKSEAGVPAEAALTLATIWTATGSNLRGPAERIRLEGIDPVEVEVSVHLHGSDLGGVLVLDTVLVLADETVGRGASTPRRAGSVLWHDQQSLRLQGDAPLFPMAITDFAANTLFPDGAAWHLQIDDNLHSAAMGSLLLVVNEKNAAVATAFQKAAKPRPVDRAVLASVYADVARVMIEHALRHDEFVDGVVFPDDSLGATLFSLFCQLFPGSSINDVRLRCNRSPNHFATELQAAVKIFEKV